MPPSVGPVPVDADVAARVPSPTRADRLLLGLVHAPVAPVTLGAVGASVALATGLPLETAAGFGAVGVVAGLAVDARVLPRVVRLGFAAPPGLLVGVYGFHAVTLFVLSMGVPVPQLALGVLAGAVAGRGRLDGARVRRLTTGSLALLGSLAALLAVARPSTGYDLQRSLGLPFAVTPGLVLVSVVVGGPLLLGAQWVCTTAGHRLAARHPVPRPPRSPSALSAPGGASMPSARSAPRTAVAAAAGR